MTHHFHTVDFETKPIEPRPQYPPEPVGVAIYEDRARRAEYLAWGHPTANNTTKTTAKRQLRALWRSGLPIAFHNAPFDLDVAEVWFDLPRLPWDKIHCTMVGGFLFDPNSRRLDLKELAEDVLGMPPEEQSALRDWLIENVPEVRRAKTKWGAHIWRAPGTIVAPYAKGDVIRTRRLARRFLDFIAKTNMSSAYERERRLFKTLISMEREGVPISTRRLEKGVRQWSRAEELTSEWICKRLKAPDLDVDSGPQLADAMEASGKVEEWILTPPSKTYPEGQRSTSMTNLLEVCVDTELTTVLGYRSKLVNGLRTFARPWLAMARETNGLIYTRFHQVRGTEGNRNLGARTGRISTTPNFQNIPKKPDAVVFTQAELRRIREVLTGGAWLLPSWFKQQGVDFSLPHLRDYVVPDEDGTINDRDYSQQELRILGHYEDDQLREAYCENPKLDVHVFAQEMINGMLEANYGKGHIKNTGFGIIYGIGLSRLALMIDEDTKVAAQIRRAYNQLFPGVPRLNKELKRRAKENEPIRTWGDRLYYVEDPIIIEIEPGVYEKRTFEYKMLNTLIQGSAGDCTKQAMINYDEVRRDARMLLTVHDQIVASAARRAAREEMQLMKEAMEAVEFDVPMLSTGKTSRSTWARAKAMRDAA